MRHVIATIVFLSLLAPVLVWAGTCINTITVDLPGACLGAGAPYRITLTNECPSGVTVFLDYPRWGKAAISLSATSTTVHYGCTADRASIVGFCLWSDSHDGCSRNRPRDINRSLEALAEVVDDRARAIEMIADQVLRYGIRNELIREYVEQVRKEVLEINRWTLAKLDGAEDGIREIAETTTLSSGQTGIRITVPRATGSRCSMYRGVHGLYHSFGLEVGADTEASAVPAAARRFGECVEAFSPNSGAAAAQSFRNAYAERRTYGPATFHGMAKVLRSLEQADTTKPFYTSTLGWILREQKVMDRVSAGNHADPRDAWPVDELMFDTRSRLRKSRNQAVRDEIEEQEELQRRAARRERGSSRTHTGQTSDVTRFDAVLFPGGAFPGSADGFRVAPSKPPRSEPPIGGTKAGGAPAPTTPQGAVPAR